MAGGLLFRGVFRFFGWLVRSLHAWIKNDIDETIARQGDIPNPVRSRVHMFFAA